jgi:hypothetical protein
VFVGTGHLRGWFPLRCVNRATRFGRSATNDKCLTEENSMGFRARWFTTLAFTIVLVSPILTVGCAEHHYRVYDDYYHDYHRWDAGEEGYYRQWATENHRDPNRDFRKLDKNDQQRYWQWRHNQSGQQDHARNHDHDHN